ncbi:TBPIP-domain-containing protein [Fistulina hepatica ATCC 64428]|uniref:TBPIP-domain-containing protein n=1 Tax=Fistulina hepatica ATCC 64428 TaxID=1128425 RepID=A0A0D7AQI3_9AGAR|nr:TBPIP-domain-containing protein [Fistulina hepatica ATCC 64428]
MASKPKADVKVLKGQEAEDKVLEYVKRMNRPYGAVDVSANLKGAVSKPNTQKILVALAEKGELVQKTYGKTSFFVANQDKIETLPAEKIAALEVVLKEVQEETKSVSQELKMSTQELTKLKAQPTDAELKTALANTNSKIAELKARLEPLHSGAVLVSADELTQIESDGIKWRVEWMRRRKIFNTFWQTITDALSPQDAGTLCEELGIELDTLEHQHLEKSGLFANAPKRPNPLKRKR